MIHTWRRKNIKKFNMQYFRPLPFSVVFILWALGVLTSGNASTLLCMIYLWTGGHYTLYLARHTLMRDARYVIETLFWIKIKLFIKIYCNSTTIFYFNIFRGAFRYLKLLFVVYMYQKRNITVSKAFAATVAKNRTKTCLIFEDTSWSFQDLEDYSNRVGNYFLDLGYKVSSK